MILAVGFLNGDVNIYDVKRLIIIIIIIIIIYKTNKNNNNNREGANWEIPIETSAGMDNTHTDPVWFVVVFVVITVTIITVVVIGNYSGS